MKAVEKYHLRENAKLWEEKTNEAHRLLSQ